VREIDYFSNIKMKQNVSSGQNPPRVAEKLKHSQTPSWTRT